MPVELTVLCWDHPRCTGPVTRAAATWQRERPDVRVRVTARPLSAFNDQPVDQIANLADLLFVDHPMMGTAVAAGALLPLDDHVEARLLAALAADSVGDSHATYQWAGRQWATAVDAACQVAVVDPVRARHFEVDPPATWEGVLETAHRIPGSVGIPLYPSDAVLSLLSLTRNLRAHGEAEDGFWSLEAVRILVELAASVDPRCFDLNPPRMLDLMSSEAHHDGPAYVPLLFGYTNYQRPQGGLGRRLSFLDTPSVGDAPAGAVLGGAGLAVSAHTPNPHEAATFATWFAGTAAQRDVVLPHGGQPGSRAVWDDPSADALVGGFFSGTRRTIDASHVRPRDAWWPGYQDAAGVLLAKLLRQHSSAAAVHSELTGLLTRARPQEHTP